MNETDYYISAYDMHNIWVPSLEHQQYLEGDAEDAENLVVRMYFLDVMRDLFTNI
jgi:hypothetical protein